MSSNGLSIYESTCVLLSRYRHISICKSLQLKEFDSLIYHIKKDIYPAFLNRQKPLSDVEIKNMINDYIQIINQTLKKMKNEIYKAKRNNDPLSAVIIKKYYLLILCNYINKSKMPKAKIEIRCSISASNFSREERKAIEMFTEYMLPIAHKKGYEIVSADKNQIFKLIQAADNAIIKYYKSVR